MIFWNKIDEKFFHFLQKKFFGYFFVIHSFVVKVGKAEMVL